MADELNADFRKPTEPRVAPAGLGDNKIPPPKESGLDRYNRERREKNQSKKDAAEQERKDQEIIAPAIAASVAKGMNVRGPAPADTAFTPMAGHADAIHCRCG